MTEVSIWHRGHLFSLQQPPSSARAEVVQALRGDSKKDSHGNSTPDAFDLTLGEVRGDRFNPNQPRDKRGRWTIVRGTPTMLGQAASGGGGASSGADEFKDFTIRDLKKVAREAQVTNYSTMTKEELKTAIVASKSAPAQQERIEKTLQKKRIARKYVRELPGGKLAQDWQKLNKVIKAAGVGAELGALGIAAFLGTRALGEYRKRRDEYTKGAADSAAAAETRAQTYAADEVTKENLVFAVGGYSGMGSTGDKLKAELTKETDDPDDGFFQDSAEVVAFNNQTYDLNPVNSPKLPGGIPNPAYLGEVMGRSSMNWMGQLFRKRNDDAVELASQIYAYAVHRGGDSGQKRVNDSVPITMVAHGAGGQTVDEALQILSKMHLPGAEKGSEILNRVNVVKLGSHKSPFMKPPVKGEGGRNSNYLSSLQTITSPNDPFNSLPKDNDNWQSDVPGGDLEDYMSSPSVRGVLRSTMGFEADTYYQKERRTKQSAGKEQSRAARREFEQNRRKQSGATTPSPVESSTQSTGSDRPKQQQTTSKPKSSNLEGDDPKTSANKSPLMQKRKEALVKMAEQMGVSTSGTKAEIIARMRSGEKKKASKQDALHSVIASLREVPCV